LHFAGLQGYPRKYLDYSDIISLWNILASLGALIRTFSMRLFIYLLIESFNKQKLILIEDKLLQSPERRYSNYTFSHSFLTSCVFVKRNN